MYTILCAIWEGYLETCALKMLKRSPNRIRVNLLYSLRKFKPIELWNTCFPKTHFNFPKYTFTQDLRRQPDI